MASPLTTRDVDICKPLTRENLLRLEKALTGFNPFHRQTQQQIPFSVASDFPGGLKKLYQRSDLGVLDCPGEVPGLGGYEEVRVRSVVVTLPFGECRVLNLPALIQAKKAVGRTQDKLSLLHLKKIQERQNKPQT